jgi:hypothetical protein
VSNARRAAGAAGQSPTSAHRTRCAAAFATAADLGGADLLAIVRHAGWESLTMLDRYIADAGLFRDNPAARISL